MMHHPTVTRRRLLGTAAALPAASALAACAGDDPAPAAAGPPDQVTYVTGFGLFGREGYAQVAVAKGFFAEQNLEVTIEPGAGGPPNHQALVGGAAQFTAVDSSGAFARHAAGQDGLRVISAVQQLPLAAIITLEGTGITRPQDLAGRTIGGAAGSVIENLFPAYADLAGFDPGTVRFEHLAPPQLPAVLAGGQVDAVGLFLVGQPAVEAAGGGREAVVLPYGDILSDLYGTVTVTTARLVADDPGLVRRFNTALLQGLEYAIDHPGEAGDLVAEQVPETDPEVAAAELELMAPYVRAGLAPGEPVGTMHGSKLARAVALLQAIEFVDSGSGLAHEQDIIAWDLVPGSGEDR